jgi:hypothetical protein
MRIFVGVEDVHGAEFSHREPQPVGGPRSGKPVDVGRDLRLFAAKVDRLPRQPPLIPSLLNI